MTITKVVFVFVTIMERRNVDMDYLLASEVTVADLIEFINNVKDIYSSLGVIAAIGLPYVETLVPIAPLFFMLSFSLSVIVILPFHWAFSIIST